MPIRTDFHLHTDRSVDAATTLGAMVERAAELGLQEIAVTDHFDNNPADEGTGRYDPIAATAATRKAADAETARPGGRRLVIRSGVELSEPHLYERAVAVVYGLHLDVIVGAIHYVGAHGVHADLFDVCPPVRAIELYFEAVRAMVETSDIDVLGHLDYFDRYTTTRKLPAYDPAHWRNVIEAILRTIMRRGIALEINTSGYRNGLGRPFPHPAVIDWYRDLGGRLLSIGSDAHEPRALAVGYDPTADLLLRLGFVEYHLHRNRRALAVPLPR